MRSASDPRLVVPIKPIRGDQKCFAITGRLSPACNRTTPAEIAKFRAANAAIEARLWRKLPQRMEEMEFLYGGLRASPKAGEAPR